MPDTHVMAGIGQIATLPGSISKCSALVPGGAFGKVELGILPDASPMEEILGKCRRGKIQTSKSLDQFRSPSQQVWTGLRNDWSWEKWRKHNGQREHELVTRWRSKLRHKNTQQNQIIDRFLPVDIRWCYAIFSMVRGFARIQCLLSGITQLSSQDQGFFDLGRRWGPARPLRLLRLLRASHLAVTTGGAASFTASSWFSDLACTFRLMGGANGANCFVSYI